MQMKYAPPSFVRIVRSLNEISKTMMRNTIFFFHKHRCVTFVTLLKIQQTKFYCIPIDDHATLAQQKFVAFEGNIIVGPHTEIIWFFQFISIYKYLKSFHVNSIHRVYIDCESKVFLLYFNCFLMC